LVRKFFFNFLEKKPDDIFKTWVATTQDLGLDEIHYLALNALAIFMIYLRLKGSIKAKFVRPFLNEEKSPAEIYGDNLEFLVDFTCPNIAKDILTSLGCDFTVQKFSSYKGKIFQLKNKISIEIFKNFGISIEKIFW